MSRRRKGNRRRNGRFRESNDVDPMSYTGNLSDAMLILAVGIMLALIIHWNVDVSTTGGDMSDSGISFSESVEAEGSGGDNQIDKDNAISFQEEDMEAIEDEKSKELSEGEGMDRIGEIYYDAASGKYYVIKQETTKQEESESK